MKTKDKIKNACLDLFIDKGIEGTSTKMILEHSGVSNGSLFNHFPSKEDIVKELYVDIKKDQLANFKEKLDVTKATRPFIYDFWTISVAWHLDNQSKSLYLEVFNNSSIIRNCTEDDTRSLFYFIENRIQKALNDEEIVSHDTTYFLLYFMNAVRSVVLYLQLSPENRNEDFIKHQFDQYWRSIVKF